MATIMHVVKNVPRHLPHGTARRGISGLLVDKGERYGAAAAFGYAKTYYGQRFIWRGHGADLWLGVGSLLLASIAAAATSGRSGLSDHLERLGDAGVMSAIGSIAASYGLEHSGGKAAVHKVKGMDVLGAIAAAKAGPFLTPEAMANFAHRR